MKLGLFRFSDFNMGAYLIFLVVMFELNSLTIKHRVKMAMLIRPGWKQRAHNKCVREVSNKQCYLESTWRNYARLMGAKCSKSGKRQSYLLCMDHPISQSCSYARSSQWLGISQTWLLQDTVIVNNGIELRMDQPTEPVSLSTDQNGGLPPTHKLSSTSQVWLIGFFGQLWLKS